MQWSRLFHACFGGVCTRNKQASKGCRKGKSHTSQSRGSLPKQGQSSKRRSRPESPKKDTLSQCFGGNYLGWASLHFRFISESRHPISLSGTTRAVFFSESIFLVERQPHHRSFVIEGAPPLRLPGCSLAPRPANCNTCLVRWYWASRGLPQQEREPASLSHTSVYPRVRVRSATVCN